MDKFIPSWWAPGQHRQTILSALLPVKKIDSLHRQKIAASDGELLEVDFLRGPVQSPVFILLHGLEGSSEAPYIRAMLRKIQTANCRAAAVNMRGCGGSANEVQETYHAGKTEDLACVIESIRKDEDNPPIYLIGYSLGGNLVLKWLGEQAEAAVDKIRSAVVVSVPYDLKQSVAYLDCGFNKAVYTRALLSGLKRKALEKEQRYPGILSKDKIKKCDTLAAYDQEVTARLNGFQDADDYWTQSSSIHYLEKIRVRTLLIHAEDDPFFPGRHFPHSKVEQSSYIKHILTEKGGHLGFLSGPAPWKRTGWLEDAIMHFC